MLFLRSHRHTSPKISIPRGVYIFQEGALPPRGGCEVPCLYPLSSMSGLATIDKDGRWSVIKIWELCIEVISPNMIYECFGAVCYSSWFCNKWLEGT